MNSRIPSGSIVLVTGASSGIGLHSSVTLARRGLHVVATMRDLGRSQRLDEAMAEAACSCDKVQLDVTDPASVDAALSEITERIGPVEVLVNNAGFAMGGFVEDVTMAELREQFETNFFGLVALTKAILPGMRDRRRGRIINISSLSGRVAQPGFGAYAASKFAVEGLSESLRHELLPHGVFVVLIEPGMFRTDIVDRNRRIAAAALDPSSPNYEATQRLKDVVEDRIARRSGDPVQVAELVGLAATAERPKLRYLVGNDAVAMSTLKGILPFGLWERAVQRVTRGD